MAKAALELILRTAVRRLDMAILDVMMPGMDGFEVLRELREQEHGETHLPVMLLTARAEDADQVRGLEGGADDYVTKPFSPIVLAARVRTLLKREGRAGAPPRDQLGQAVGQ
ncbi:MAG: response regulator transcription factor [Butyricicoccaceae bacterium]